MTEFLDKPLAAGLVRLSGTVSSYSVKRDSASFFFTRSNQTTFGMIAIAASLAGMGGQAMSIAGNASAMEEAADHVQFTIDGKQIRGWLWRSPFKEGDLVDVAVEWQGDHYELLGVARPADRTIALYPHCTRSKRQHIKNAIKWWFYVVIFFDVVMAAVTGSYDSMTLLEFWTGVAEDGGAFILPAMHIIFAIAIFSMTRQWLPFAEVADKVFRTLALPNPGSIDLVRSSRGRHTTDDSCEFGATYFRY